MLENNCGEISINPKDYMEFMKNSQQIFLPESNVEKGKVIDRNFHNSCMLVQIAGKGYQIGELDMANGVGYSMIISGEKKWFSYSETEAIFKPKLC